MSQELYLEDFDDTSIFENKAGLAEVNILKEYRQPTCILLGHEVPGLDT